MNRGTKDCEPSEEMRVTMYESGRGRDVVAIGRRSLGSAEVLPASLPLWSGVGTLVTNGLLLTTKKMQDREKRTLDGEDQERGVNPDLLALGNCLLGFIVQRVVLTHADDTVFIVPVTYRGCVGLHNVDRVSNVDRSDGVDNSRCGIHRVRGFGRRRSIRQHKGLFLDGLVDGCT